MTLNLINVGAVADDGTGDPLRTAFQKTNDGLTQLNKQNINDVYVNSEADFPAPTEEITADGNDQNTFQLITNTNMNPGDFVELKVANTTGTADCLIESCQFIVRGDV